MVRPHIPASHTKPRQLGVSGFLILAAWVWGITLPACDTGSPSATITAEEFRFTPNLVKLPARQKVRVIVRNQGRERHVFQSPILIRQGVLFERPVLQGPWNGSEGVPIQPGKRIEFSLVLPEGLYPFRCQIRGHKGMEGTLVVQK